MNKVLDKTFNNKDFRENLLKVSSVLCFISQSFYLYRYIYIHEQFMYAGIIIASMIVVSGSIYCSFKKRIKLASTLLIIPSTICVTVLIGSVGGLQAPGLQWIALVPILFGVLYGSRGFIPGILVFLAIFFSYAFFEFPNFIPTQEDYFKEKIVNFILFSGFIVLFTYLYVRIIENYERNLQEKSDQVQNLLRVLLHDLSTPAQVINISTQLSKKYLPEKDYERLKRSSKAIETIIHDVRTLQSHKDNKAKLFKKNTSVEKLINDLNPIFDGKCKTKNIKLEVINNVTSLREVYTDASIFKNQVLNNLVSNAIKFSPKNETVSIIASEHDNSLIIEVIDRGAGISIEHLDTLFNPHQATSTKGTAGEKGTGYGLPLAKSFLEKLGGDISVFTKDNDSSIERGTCFSISMPFNSFD